jgi:PIN domain nuclease of toxin-antitoxin system
MIMLDTSALLFWTLDPDRLSERAAKSILAADSIVISSISIWEIGLKVKRGKLQIPLSIDHYADGLQHLDGLEIRDVDVPTWLQNLALRWDHRDPADRTIVATAQQLGCPLVASDRKIASFYEKTIW